MNNDVNNGLNSQVLGSSPNNVNNGVNQNPNMNNTVMDGTIGVTQTPTMTEGISGVNQSVPVQNVQTPVNNGSNVGVQPQNTVMDSNVMTPNAIPNQPVNNNTIMPNNTVLDASVPTQTPTPVVANDQTYQAQNNSQVYQASTPVNNTSISNNDNNISNMNNGTPAQPVYPNNQPTNGQPAMSMPGFESSTIIGTTPPVSLEPEKQPKKKGSNKILFILIIIVVLCAVGGGVYFLLQSGILNSESTNVSIVLKDDLTFNLGETLSTNISDYADISGTNITNCSLDTLSVDINTEGTYSFTVTCGEIVKTGQIVIVDNSELVVTTQTVYKAVGDTVTADEFVVNASNNVTYSFTDSESVQTYLQTAGTYTVTISGTTSTKSSESTAQLVVLENAIKGYLTCVSASQTLSDISATMAVKEKFAIMGDNNAYAGISEEIYEFTFTDETIFNTYKMQYNTNGSLLIDGYSGTPSFDENSLIIELINERDNEEVLSDYGEENMQTFGTISSYFASTLGYSCSYSKVE